MTQEQRRGAAPPRRSRWLHAVLGGLVGLVLGYLAAIVLPLPAAACAAGGALLGAAIGYLCGIRLLEFLLALIPS
jgi:hypothetical protein